MKICITGAKGQLGTELSRRINDSELLLLDLPEFDISDNKQLEEVFLNNKADIIINCAAYTDVDGCESNEKQAYRVNALGPRNLAVNAEKIGAKLVHISTDYVFDGRGKNVYREDSAVNPINVYGKSKLLGEKYVENFSSRYFIIRTAWLYGAGSNFVRTMLKLAEERDELDVVDDQIGTPTSTADLAEAVINIMDSEYYGLYHGTSEGSCSWYDFAELIFKIKGIDIKLNRVTSDQFKRPACRPQYSVLDNFMFKLQGMNSFRQWQEALKQYLREEI